jgi:hypothetical protein
MQEEKKGRRRLHPGVVVAVTAVIAVAGVATARAAWVDQHCAGGGYRLLDWKRSDAATYFEPLNHEGYEWGGG